MPKYDQDLVCGTDTRPAAKSRPAVRGSPVREPKRKKKRIQTFTISAELSDELDIYCANSGSGRIAVIVDALSRYLLERSAARAASAYEPHPMINGGK